MLPLEIIVDIAKYLRYEDKIMLKRTCKFLNQMIDSIYIPFKYWNRIKEMDCNYLIKYIEQIYEIETAGNFKICNLPEKLKKKRLKLSKIEDIDLQILLPEELVLPKEMIKTKMMRTNGIFFYPSNSPQIPAVPYSYPNINNTNPMRELTGGDKLYCRSLYNE